MCRLGQPHDGQKRLVFTSDGVGVGIVSGVVRALMTLSSTESESEESERFHFLPTTLMSPSLRSAYDLVKTRLSESDCRKRKYKPISMRAPMLSDWFCFSASACDSDNLVFT